MTDLGILAAQTYTLIIILLSSIVFARLALKGKNLGSYRVQLSVFILIWAAAEMPRAATNLGLISASSYGTVGLFLHFISMASFAVFVGAKSFKFFGALPQGASSTPTPSIPGLPVNPSENPDQ
ncbi:MAG: hypothetical protein AUF79_12970 [Crenarchaeota archaeon 13_1_20CM_2_51_8]|nr:MAG: hypothetical protein AUF79_12970 [Crenarchaeota archaeon 13_1_20CM_2_51_8]